MLRSLFMKTINPTQHTGKAIIDIRLKAVVLVMLMMTLACTSVSDFVGMTDPNDPGLNDKELEDDSMGSVRLPDIALTQGAYVLTPEEMSNVGQHKYTYEVYLGDQVNKGTAIAKHVFSETGVTYYIDDNNPLEFIRTDYNVYTLENGNISIRYFMVGYETTMTSGHHYIFTIAE